MKTSKIRLMAIAAALLGLVFLAVASRKTVTLLIDGRSQTFVTRAFTVRGALRAAEIAVHEEDRIIPLPATWIKDGQAILFTSAVPVSISTDGQIFHLFTAERIPANLLALAEVPLYPGDRILFSGLAYSPDESLPSAASYDLHVRRAVAVRIDLPGTGERLEFSSAAATLGEAVSDAGINLYVADKLDPPPSTPLLAPLVATLSRSRLLQIVFADQTLSIRSAASTIGQALAQAGLPLQGLDFSLPSPGQPLPQDGKVRVVRVQEQVVIKQQPLPFGVLLQPLPEVDIDTLQTVQSGEYGLEAQRLRVRYEDGIEVSSQVDAKWVAREPLPRIDGYGTKITIQSMNTPDGPIEYWRAHQFYATSYSPSRSGTSPDVSWYGHVYCGGLMKNGYVGVDLKHVPCGTRLYIPGYGFAVAMDTGNIAGAWIDLGYLDEDYVTWHQYVTVYFLTPVPPLDQISWLIPEGTFW
ncbi:MAG: ubiquitin-like domain-containing protein [Anaerolineae bacterium]|nr:ubiquitin-like domain-containing protein [Anaerolineae bacterium]